MEYIEGYRNLPKPLSNDKLYQLLSNKDEISYNEIITSHIAYVMKHIKSRFPNTPIEFEDLVQIGMTGFIRAVYTFNPTSNNFYTYASKCIDNAILYELRTLSKGKNYTFTSLEETINLNKHGEDGQDLKDTIPSDISVEEQVIKKVIGEIIRSIISKLEGRDKDIIGLRYGFYDGTVHEQKELAEKYHTHVSAISRREKELLEYIKNELSKPMKEHFITMSDYKETADKILSTLPSNEGMSILIDISQISILKAIKTFKLQGIDGINTYVEKTIKEELLTQIKKPNVVSGIIMPPMFSDDYIIQAERILDNRSFEEQLQALITNGNLEKVLSILTERERISIELFYGLYDGEKYTHEEISRMLNVQRPTISKAIKKAHEKINAYLDLNPRLITKQSIKNNY